ncbi:DMT family transporter [Herbaspirillum sp. YR522]|uniref:DMT family transporter n=1 Tax=Herbaspirillum sp. YR522 TaxID=1144342 RepID=UPI00026F99CD|nr:DMT family transporter [Herbaspirillum sp. YR522]EJN06623.1 EamA-like transporter family [Herbaspirillum sp. YR522]
MQGILLALFGAMLLGANTILSKWLLATVTPVWVAATLCLGAGLVALAVRRVQPLPCSAPGPASRGSKACFALALVLGAVAAPLMLMFGLQSTNASTASVLTNVEGLLSVLIAWLLFGERQPTAGWIGVTLILVGVLAFSLVNADQFAGNLGGIVLVALAYACWAVDLNLMRLVVHLPHDTATAIRGLTGGTALAFIALLLGEPVPQPAWLLACLACGAASGVSFILTLKALPLIGTARTGAILAVAPLFAYLMSFTTQASAQADFIVSALCMGLAALGVGVSLAASFNSTNGEPAGT